MSRREKDRKALGVREELERKELRVRGEREKERKKEREKGWHCIGGVVKERK